MFDMNTAKARKPFLSEDKKNLVFEIEDKSGTKAYNFSIPREQVEEALAA